MEPQQKWWSGTIEHSLKRPLCQSGKLEHRPLPSNKSSLQHFHLHPGSALQVPKYERLQVKIQYKYIFFPGPIDQPICMWVLQKIWNCGSELRTASRCTRLLFPLNLVLLEAHHGVLLRRRMRPVLPELPLLQLTPIKLAISMSIVWTHLHHGHLLSWISSTPKVKLMMTKNSPWCLSHHTSSIIITIDTTISLEYYVLIVKSMNGKEMWGLSGKTSSINLQRSM